MARKKMTTYVDEDLLRSAKILAARRNGKIYEVFEEALRRYLEEPKAAEESRPRQPGLRDLLVLERDVKNGHRERPLPGAPDAEAEELPEGATLSGAVLAEREERSY